MGKLKLPEHLELLLTDEPFLDLYGYGPWQVPGGLAREVFSRARELAASPEARSLRAELPEFYLPEATAVGADLTLLTSFLCGEAAVRSGHGCYVEFEFFGEFQRDTPLVPHDPLQWTATVGRWRPPGFLLFEDPDRRDAGLALAGECLRVLEGVTPLEARRTALAGLHARMAERHDTASDDLAGTVFDREDRWAGAARSEEIAAVPELAGPEGYLVWAYEGFAAAHERLAAVVAGSSSPDSSHCRTGGASAADVRPARAVRRDRH